MFVSMASLLSDSPVRGEVAMTGEITLRGLALPIGGVKEKVLAAKRAGIRTVILPERNRKDLADVPKHVHRGLTFEFVRHVDKVLRIALSGKTIVIRSEPSMPSLWRNVTVGSAVTTGQPSG